MARATAADRTRRAVWRRVAVRPNRWRERRRRRIGWCARALALPAPETILPRPGGGGPYAAGWRQGEIRRSPPPIISAARIPAHAYLLARRRAGACALRSLRRLSLLGAPDGPSPGRAVASGQVATCAIESGRESGSGWSIRSSSGLMRRSIAPRSGTLRRLSSTCRLAAAHVDRPAGEGFDQDQSETVDVGLRPHVAAEQAELLGRDIVVLAGKPAADDGVIAELRGTRDAEVDDLGARDIAARDHDVVGRYVAVDDAALVRHMQAGGDPLEQRSHRLVGERLAPDDFGERLPFDEFHREIGAAQRRLDREDVVSNDRLVLQIVQRRGFAAEQRERGIVSGEVGQQHLDRRPGRRSGWCGPCRPRPSRRDAIR